MKESKEVILRPPKLEDPPGDEIPEDAPSMESLFSVRAFLRAGIEIERLSGSESWSWRFLVSSPSPSLKKGRYGMMGDFISPLAISVER
jgi:hypothetical protein